MSSVLYQKYRCLDCWLTRPRVLGAKAALHLASTCPPAGATEIPYCMIQYLQMLVFQPSLHCCRARLVWENRTVTCSTSTTPFTGFALSKGCLCLQIFAHLLGGLFPYISYLLQAASPPLLVLTSHLQSSVKGVPVLPGPADHLLAR